MAESLSRLIFAYISTAGTFDALYACRLHDDTYADPVLPFDEASNAWYLLSETTIGDPSDGASFYTAELPDGIYRIVKHDTVEGYTELIPYENIHHSTMDGQNHLIGDEESLRHTHNHINIAEPDEDRLGHDLRQAIDNFIGSDWDVASDDSLKDHLDTADNAHPASAILHTVGLLTSVDEILDDHEIRLYALENGTATTPTNINDISGEIGIDLYWDEQDVEGIEYYIRYLWKHSYETLPSFANLEHQSRIGSPFFNINYGTRRFDIAINTDSDLVLYYAIGAKGRADTAISWSAVLSTGVIIPKYVQQQIVTLGSVSVQQLRAGTGSELINSDELFPTCTGETDGEPDDNFLIWGPLDDVRITEIKLRSGSAMSGDAVIKYRAPDSGGSFTVSSAARRGAVTGINLNVDDGQHLKIWSLAPQGIGHYTIQIKFEIRGA